MFKNKINKFSLMVRNFLLYFSIIFFLVFSAVQINFFSVIPIFPNIASMLIFFFLIMDQEDVQYFAIFIFGLLFDIFNNLPLGATSATWLVSSKFISFLRLHLYTPDNFVITFRDFTIYAFLNMLIQWMIISLLYKIPYPFSISLIQFVLNLGVFAILYKLLKKLERWFR